MKRKDKEPFTELTDHEILVWVSKGCPYTERTSYITVTAILAIMAERILNEQSNTSN